MIIAISLLVDGLPLVSVLSLVNNYDSGLNNKVIGGVYTIRM